MFNIKFFNNMNEETEIWRDVEGYEGLYKVSNLGNVMSLKGKKPRLLRAGKSNRGYLFVGLRNHNKYRKEIYLHRLVAQAFIPNPQNFPCVNNRVDNLEFCTQKYNNQYGTHYERISKSLTNRKDQSKAVLQYNKNGNFINEYPSVREAERKTGIINGNICSVCKGKLKSAGGYIWRYTDEV